eukprot:10780717-Alexandrium_andersonii.AAC.1
MHPTPPPPQTLTLGSRARAKSRGLCGLRISRIAARSLRVPNTNSEGVDEPAQLQLRSPEAMLQLRPV